MKLLLLLRYLLSLHVLELSFTRTGDEPSPMLHVNVVLSITGLLFQVWLSYIVKKAYTICHPSYLGSLFACPGVLPPKLVTEFRLNWECLGLYRPNVGPTREVPTKVTGTKFLTKRPTIQTTGSLHDKI